MWQPQDVQQLRRESPAHPHLLKSTCSCKEAQVDLPRLPSLAHKLASCESLTGGERVCVAYGYGSQPRYLYESLRGNRGLDVLWRAPILPIIAYPLSLLCWCYGGLVRIFEADALPKAWAELSKGAMVEIYSFRTESLNRVHRHVRRRRWLSRIGRVIGEDSSYFCLGADGSHAPAPAWYSHGEHCPDELVTAVEWGGSADHPR